MSESEVSKKYLSSSSSSSTSQTKNPLTMLNRPIHRVNLSLLTFELPESDPLPGKMPLGVLQLLNVQDGYRPQALCGPNDLGRWVMFCLSDVSSTRARKF